MYREEGSINRGKAGEEDDHQDHPYPSARNQNTRNRMVTTIPARLDLEVLEGLGDGDGRCGASRATTAEIGGLDVGDVVALQDL